MRIIDLRSDTVTQPTDTMREAMCHAPVGDDVYGDDPTLNELERLAAEMLGKPDALFVPSGTMGNQLAVMTHIRKGDEVVLGMESHIMEHEVGAAAILSGAFMRPLTFENGIPDPAWIERSIRGEDIHYPETGLICVEEPLSNGRVVPLETLQKVKNVAEVHGIPVHMDGARVFNAATALGVDVKRITACADSVMACLSKGLCAPVGSILAGSEEFIRRARKNRKILGGGMRQAGILAAAGLIALKDMTRRLGEDHENARYMAAQLAKCEGISVDEAAVEINMVFFSIDKPAEFKAKLAQELLCEGIKINGEDQGLFRFVTHHGVTKKDIDKVASLLKSMLEN